MRDARIEGLEPPQAYNQNIKACLSWYLSLVLKTRVLPITLNPHICFVELVHMYNITFPAHFVNTILENFS